MASNPLYPGYVPSPKDAPINPLYPGYFPGQAEVRLPRGPDIKPNEFNFDQITQIIDAVAANYMLAGPDLPRWVVDRALDDFKQNLKASIKPADVAQEDLDDYDTNSLPGAFGINVNLNPLDWINDPQKTATNTLTNWWKSGVSWKDMETKFRTEAWQQVFNENAPGNFKFGTAEELGVEMLGINLGAAVGLKYEKTANPLRLKGRSELEVDATSLKEGAYEINDIQLDTAGNVKSINRPGVTLTGKVDLGEKFATSLREFEVMGGFGSKREEKFDNVAYNGYRTVVTEMDKHKEAISQVASNSAHAAALGAAKARLNIMDSMSGIEEELKEYLKATRKTILKKENAAPVLIDRDGNGVARLNIEIRKNLAAIDTQMTNLAGSINPLEKAEANFIKNKYIDNYKKQIDSVLNQPLLKMAQEAALDPTKKTAIEAQIKAMNAKAVVNALSGNIEGGFISRPLFGGQPFAPSIQRIFLRDSLQDIDRPGLRGSIAIGNLVNDVVHADPSAASQIIIGAINFTRNEAQTMGAMEILSSIDKGEFMEKYIWPRVKTYWSASTPGAYIDRVLKRQHYFGLTLAESSDKDFETSIWNKAANLRQRSGGLAPNSTYGNWFTVKGSGGIAGVNITARLYGGDHFQVVGKLNSIIGKGLGTAGNEWSVSDFEKLLEVKDLKGLMALSGKVSAIHLPKGLSAGNQKALEEFAEGVGNLKKWLDDNEHRILVTGVAKGSPEYYAALIRLLNEQNLNPDTSDITRRYIGHLQKLYFKLNAAQSAFITKYGKIIAPFAYARKIIVDFLAALVTKALQVIGGAATGGALAAFFATIEPLIRFIINVVVGKAMEIAKVFYDAIIKADTEAVFKYVDKSVEKYAKVLLGIIGAYTMLVVVPADRFMGTMAVSFSPVDNTRNSGIGDLFGSSGIHYGSGVRVPSLADKPSSVYGFIFKDYTVDIVTSIGTFKLAPWPAKWRGIVDLAIKELQLKTGGYLGRLSAPSVGGEVNLLWAEPGNGGFCGIALGKDNISGNDAIIIGNGNCFDGFSGPAWYYNYLFAHETGHIYNYRYGFESFDGMTFESTDDGGEGTLTTYPGVCDEPNSSSEDFADTIGNWVQLNTYDCGGIPTESGTPGDPCSTGFWQDFPKHCEYADKVLTRP